jgi:hypothetical protein
MPVYQRDRTPTLGLVEETRAKYETERKDRTWGCCRGRCRNPGVLLFPRVVSRDAGVELRSGSVARRRKQMTKSVSRTLYSNICCIRITVHARG